MFCLLCNVAAYRCSSATDSDAIRIQLDALQCESIRAGKNPRFFTKVLGFTFYRFLGFFVRTRKCDPKAHEKHPIHGTPYLTKDKSPVSEGEHRAKNEDEIDESHKSQLKF